MLEIDRRHAGYGRTMVLFGVDFTVPDRSAWSRSWATTAPARRRCCGSLSGCSPCSAGTVLLRRRGHHQDCAPPAGGARPGVRPAGPAVLPAADHAREPAAGRRRPPNGTAEIDEVLDLFPALTNCSRPAGRPAVGRPAPAARHRPGPAHQAAAADPRRADRGHPAQRRRRDRGRSSSAGRRGDLTVLLVEQHVGFALTAAAGYAVMASGYVTSTGEGGSAAVGSVMAAMTI